MSIPLETLLLLKDEAMRAANGVDRAAVRNIYLVHGAMSNNPAFLKGYLASLDMTLAMTEESFNSDEMNALKEYLQDRVNTSRYGDSYSREQYEEFGRRLWQLQSRLERRRQAM